MDGEVLPIRTEVEGDLEVDKTVGIGSGLDLSVGIGLEKPDCGELGRNMEEEVGFSRHQS